MVFKINFKGKETVIPISQEDHITITIYDRENVNHLLVGTLDKDLKQHTWLKDSSTDIDDSITVQSAERSEEVSEPMQTIVADKVIRKSKLETFIELENDLKQRGLL